MTPLPVWRWHTMANCERCPLSGQPKVTASARCPHCGERFTNQDAGEDESS